MKFYGYKKCSTVKKAKKWLVDNNISFEEIDLVDTPPTKEELKKIYEESGYELKKFFNTSGLLYKSMELKDKLPKISEEEQLKLLATDEMLVKRPLVIRKDFVLVGFKESEWIEVL